MRDVLRWISTRLDNREESAIRITMSAAGEKGDTDCHTLRESRGINIECVRKFSSAMIHDGKADLLVVSRNDLTHVLAELRMPLGNKPRPGILFVDCDEYTDDFENFAVEPKWIPYGAWGFYFLDPAGASSAEWWKEDEEEDEDEDEDDEWADHVCSYECESDGCSLQKSSEQRRMFRSSALIQVQEQHEGHAIVFLLRGATREAVALIRADALNECIIVSELEEVIGNIIPDLANLLAENHAEEHLKLK